MTPRGRSARYPLGARGDETEALQTDVMRFMAILGLCLTAVFALVQGLPQGDASQARAGLAHETAVQRARARALAVELQRLNADIAQARGRQREARQVLGRLQAHREQARVALEALTASLETARRELAGIEQALRDKDQELEGLSHRLQAQRARLDGVQRRLKALDARGGETPPETPVPAPPAPDQQRGFTLRFASSEALDRLVAAGSVRFYAVAGGQAWRLSLPGGDAAFARGALPGRFHEMAPATVPPRYLSAFAHTGDAPGRTEVVWAVELPPGTEQRIASLTRGRRGGALVIQPDGRVALESGAARE